MAVLAITELSPTLVEVAYVIFRPNTPGVGQIGDGALAIVLLVLRSLCGRAWKPVEVKIAHRRPKNARPYRGLFKAPISFDAPRFALVVPAKLLDRQLPGANAAAEAAIEAVIARAGAVRPLSLTLRVKRIVAAMLVGCSPSFPQIASALGMSARTLRRRLADEGTTVTVNLDEAKAEFARQLIVETRMSIHEIAQTLHYAKPGAFSRAYKCWMGMTPLSARKAAALRAVNVGRSKRH